MKFRSNIEIAAALFFSVSLFAFRSGAEDQSPLDGLAASSKNDAQALILLGDLYLEAGRLNDAAKSYKEAQKLSKGSNEPALGMAKIAIFETNVSRAALNKAKKACASIVSKGGQDATGEICSGELWLSMDRSARAIDEFQKAIKKNDVKRGEAGMGDALRLRADYAGAISSYEKAIQAGAGHVARIGLGISLESKGDRESALKALGEAVELQPASCLAQFHYGRTLGRGNEAISHLKIALAIRPGWIEAMIALGDAHLESRDYASAAESYQKAIESKAQGGRALLGLGKALHLAGRENEAKEALAKAIEAVPNLVEAYLVLAEIHAALGDQAEAINALEKAQSFSGDDADVYLKMGETYFRLGRHTVARSFLTKVISMRPKMSRPYFILGNIACERKLYDAAQSYYASALSGDMAGVDKKEIESKMSACKTR